MIPQHRRSPLLSSPHGFFGREGGVSKGAFAGLNGSFYSGDDFEPVQENRRRMSLALGGAQIVTAKQTHSADAIFIDEPFPWDQRPEADAIVTANPGIAVAVLAADCVPILFEGNGIVAAAHAGWKGSLAGIIESTVRLMEDHGADRQHIKAAIGPHLRAPLFEVRQDLIDLVCATHPDADRFFTPKTGDQFVYDHTSFVIARLQEAGITKDRINDVSGNTLETPETLYSYRFARQQNEDRFGHNLSAICTKPA